ncbi:hypothetical protein ON010_g3992 [Phytophthora cinnamomi]|nr:hypothetical protein ON010_g3992 [Phytophthora cinnamomi]
MHGVAADATPFLLYKQDEGTRFIAIPVPSDMADYRRVTCLEGREPLPSYVPSWLLLPVAALGVQIITRCQQGEDWIRADCSGIPKLFKTKSNSSATANDTLKLGVNERRPARRSTGRDYLINKALVVVSIQNSNAFGQAKTLAHRRRWPTSDKFPVVYRRTAPVGPRRDR